MAVPKPLHGPFSATLQLQWRSGVLLITNFVSMAHRSLHSSALSLATLALGVLVLGSCTPDPEDQPPGTITVTADFSFGGDSVLVGRTAVDHNGNHLRLETFALYLGGIELLTDTGAIRLSDAERWDAGDDNRWIYSVVPGTYEGFRVHLGVPAEFNTDTDPTIWPNDHPLGVAGSAGLFWSWNTGYIFSKFDGKADTTGGNDFTHPYAYHIGGDANLIEIRLDDPWTVDPCSRHGFSLAGDILGFLSAADAPIDPAIDNVTHTGDNPDLAARYVTGQRATVTLTRNP